MINYNFNPYWQILENSSSFFSEILVFQVMTHESWTRPYCWKTHPSKIYEYLFSFFQNRGVSQTVCTGKLEISKKMDEFSSITVWLMTRKTKISETKKNGWVFQDLPLRIKIQKDSYPYAKAFDCIWRHVKTLTMNDTSTFDFCFAWICCS